MVRPSVSFDVFSAVAAPGRRRILEVLGERQLPVNDLVDALGLPQPTVSKHLAVLRRAGIVRVQRRQRQKLYAMNPEPVKSIHDWTRQFERMWDDQLQRIKSRAEEKARKREKGQSS